jgi:hypothetical protein
MIYDAVEDHHMIYGTSISATNIFVIEKESLFYSFFFLDYNYQFSSFFYIQHVYMYVCIIVL